MEKCIVEIEGTSPLLMNKYNVQAELDRQKVKRITKTYEPTDEADKSAYKSTDGKNLIIPSQVLYASILNASSFHKINRRSAKSILAGSIRIEPEEIKILDEKDKALSSTDFEIDTRPVVIQRARVSAALLNSSPCLCFSSSFDALSPTLIKALIRLSRYDLIIC